MSCPRLGRHVAAEGFVDPGRGRQRRGERDAAGEPFGVGGMGGAQQLGALLPLDLGQAVMHVVGRHQAKGDMAMLGVVLPTAPERENVRGS